MACFSLVTLALLPLWMRFSPHYLAVLAQLVDAGALLLGLPVRCTLPPANDAGVVSPGLVAGVAAFVATPGRSVRWKAGWIGLLAIAAGALQVLLLLTQLYVGYGQAFAAQQAGGNTEAWRWWVTALEQLQCWHHPLVDAAVWLTATHR